ncbi:hypothetical protein GOZ78_09240 [Agrobacterium vitis]|uniref:Uncharacterized protein n=1 Tax=Agrobacterium vitis TaxID=373 RepID=A0ABD6G7F8_AGRVI|nr:hypothetical protein [Agrobacterium vitis]MUO78225.1 hypothetical protein [Agrobacterium vitis]MUO94102.1 hypothetical protein [Agrobacterium vitis]MUP03443.1 hypothetical protein [Agrobacterium vitis]MUZ84990.1 hypothetical protein [Agrobacterium vitis]MVA10216.1 hypothetical protein [Agrobacterium vitis]
MAKRKRVKARETLLTTLSHLDDALTMQLMWSVNALQSDNAPDLTRYLRYPKEAAGAKLVDRHFVPKWEIENALLLMMSTPKQKVNFLREPDYRNYDTAASIINQLKNAELAEERVLLNPSNILFEVPRLAHKQFMWQRIMFEPARLYRYYFVYGQGKCAEYFEQRYSLTINDFALGCILLHALAIRAAWHKLPIIPNDLPLRNDVFEKTLGIISLEMQDMRAETLRRITNVASPEKAKIAYLPSSLRQYPIVTTAKHQKQMIAPLPQLIIFRMTSGLYYDLQEGPKSLIEEANSRFEEFGKKLLDARCPRFETLREHEFVVSKAKTYRTPDLLLKDGGVVKVVFECKATKLTFDAQFGDDPYAEAPNAYNQIAKGMSQLWKFFSRARRGIYIQEQIDPNAKGVILTMENWWQLDQTPLKALRAEAEKLCADEPDMLPEDKREVIFTSIEDLEYVLAVSDEDQFLKTLDDSQKEEFFGWALADVRNPYRKEELERKDYPFKIGEILPLLKKVAGD